MKLTGQQWQQLSEALRDAFTPQRLRELLKFRLDANLDDVTIAADYKELAFDLIQVAEAEGWTERLVQAARESIPGNPLLQEFAQQIGLAARTPPKPELERIIQEANSFLDITAWRTKLGEIETRVCRFEITSNKGLVYGTGFLVGPDVAITNYHVMEPVIAGSKGETTADGLKALPSDVVLRFDFKRLADGTTLNPGVCFLLATEWLIDASAMSSVDAKPEPKPSLPDPSELDYALVRVDGSPGSNAVGAKPDPNAEPRGWISVPDAPPTLAAHDALFIVQHPKGDPLQLALDTDAVIGMNGNNTRVEYGTSTLPGSSGSPCFDRNWNLVALHHSGDPDFDPAHKPEFNEGTPFSAIRALLSQRGLEAELAPAPA
jgi:hypothetical protein